MISRLAFSKTEAVSFGDNSPIVQVTDSSNVNIEYSNLDTKALALDISKNLLNYQCLIEKNQEIARLKKIISELNEDKSIDAEIKGQLQSGNDILAAEKLRENIDLEKNRVLEREVLHAKLVSLYSPDEAIPLYEQLLKTATKENKIKIKIEYAHTLLRLGKIDKAEANYLQLQDLVKYNFLFLKSEERQLKFGLIKSDGSYIKPEEFDFSSESIKADVFLSSYFLSISYAGLGACAVNLGMTSIAKDNFNMACKFSLICDDRDNYDYVIGMLAFNSYKDNDYSESKKYYEILSSDATFENINKFQILANIYIEEGNLEKADFYLRKGESLIDENSGTEIYEPSFFSTMARYYMLLEDEKKSQYYFDKAIYLSKSTHDFNTLCSIYLNLGFFKSKTKDYELSKRHYENAISIAKKYKYFDLLASALHNVSLCPSLTPEESITKIKLALKANSLIERKFGIIINLSQLANIYVSLKNFIKAKKYKENSIRLSKKINRQDLSDYYTYYFIVKKLPEKKLSDIRALLQISLKLKDNYKTSDSYVLLAEYFIKNEREKLAKHLLLKGRQFILRDDTKDNFPILFSIYSLLMQIHLETDDYNFNQYCRNAKLCSSSESESLLIEILVLKKNIKFNNKFQAIDQAVNISKRISSSEPEIVIFFYQLIFPFFLENKYHGDLDKCIGFLTESEAFIDYVDLYYNIASHYMVVGEILKGLKYFLICLNFYKKLGNSEMYLNTKLQTATTLFVSGDREKSIKHYEKAFLQDRLLATIDASIVGSAYTNFASLQSNSKKSIFYSKKAISLLSNSGDDRLLEIAHSNLGSTYEALGMYKRALENFKASLNIAISGLESSIIGLAHKKISNLYYNNNKIKLAKYHLNQSIMENNKEKENKKPLKVPEGFLKNNLTTKISSILNNSGFK